MSNKIIAIQGYKNSGKDTCAKMINYLLSTPKIFHNYFIYKHLKLKGKIQIVHFADKIKETLAVLFNINKEWFDNRDFKENFYIDFKELKIFDGRNCNELHKLTDSEFNRKLKKGDLNVAKKYHLTVRQTLQFYGTEIMRNFFGNKLWILTTINKENIIIADQRFLIENKEISKIKDSVIIHLVRPDCKKGYHASELECETLLKKRKYNILINNDGSKKDLFNNIKKLIHNGIIS